MASRHPTPSDLVESENPILDLRITSHTITRNWRWETVQAGTREVSALVKFEPGDHLAAEVIARDSAWREMEARWPEMFPVVTSRRSFVARVTFLTCQVVYCLHATEY